MALGILLIELPQFAQTALHPAGKVGRKFCGFEFVYQRQYSRYVIGRSNARTLKQARRLPEGYDGDPVSQLRRRNKVLSLGLCLVEEILHAGAYVDHSHQFAAFPAIGVAVGDGEK